MKRPWLWFGVAAAVVVLVALAMSGAPTPISRSGTPGSELGSSNPSGSGSLATLTTSAVSSASAVPSPAGSTAPSPGAKVTLAQLLGMLRIAPEDRTGYQRSLFVHWIDADGDGCDTRHEVLIEEAIVKPRIGARCALTGGRWISAYDGLAFTDPAKLQIDHVVPLAEAWDSGASRWTADRRMRFANDLDAWFALIAVSASTNESKSDDDPADWLPPARADECPYLGSWLATKVRWDLAVDRREHDALATEIRDCPSTTMPYLPAGTAGERGGALPTPVPSGGGAGPGASGSACDPAYPTVCIPPPPPDLDCGDIPFRNFKVLAPDPHHFDGDHDGIGCET